MLQILVLVCSTSVSPVECQPDTALDVISGPQTASVFECGLHGQALMANTTLFGRGEGEYMKIKCEHLRAPTRAKA